MSAQAWTPGPWEIARSRREGMFGIKAAAMDPLALVCMITPVVCDNIEANTRLISAAPTMAEVLIAVTKSTEWSCMERDIQDAVRAALQKAGAQ